LEASPSTGTALIDWSFPGASTSSLVVDKKGVVFSQDGDTSLPFLFFPDPTIKLGSTLNAEMFSAITYLFQKTTESLGSPFQAKIENNNLLVDTRPRIIFSLNGAQNGWLQQDILRQVASLQLILHKAKIESKLMESVDLRFDRPVVIYSPVKK
jgi:hypothetical protein